MMTPATVPNDRQYRILRAMMLVLAAISLVQILSGGTWRLVAQEVSDPTRWILSYLDDHGHRTIQTLAAPSGNSFNEGIATSPVEIEMEFRQCESFAGYRFWVGPYGRDSTDRQPGEWTLLTRGDVNDWIEADREKMAGAYRNDIWYNFPLRTHTACIRHVRWDIAKLSSGNIFRLFRFQLYNSGSLSRLYW